MNQDCLKIIGLMGKHQIGSITSGGRGINTTIVCCNNAAGMYVPSLVIFKRKKVPPYLKDGASCGSVVTCNATEWMDSDFCFCLFVLFCFVFIFLWLQDFIAYVKPSPNKKILLVLDGHSTHVKDSNAVLVTTKENVIMLSLQPHNTHKAQPLDKTFFKPLQIYE